MSIRQDRMAERVREILSELLLREISDPRLQGVTVTEVRFDPELRYANIYVNALADEDRHDEVLRGLERAKGFLRREVGRRIRLRTVPELHFHWDTTLERGERLNQLISSLNIPSTTPKPTPSQHQEDKSTDDRDDHESE